MSQAAWALLAMLGKHQEVFDFVQEVLLTDGFSLTSIYNSDVRHPVDGYFCRSGLLEQCAPTFVGSTPVSNADFFCCVVRI